MTSRKDNWSFCLTGSMNSADATLDLTNVEVRFCEGEADLLVRCQSNLEIACPLKIDLVGDFKHFLFSTLPGEMIQWFLFRVHVSLRKCNVWEPKEMFLSNCAGVEQLPRPPHHASVLLKKLADYPRTTDVLRKDLDKNQWNSSWKLNMVISKKNNIRMLISPKLNFAGDQLPATNDGRGGGV